MTRRPILSNSVALCLVALASVTCSSPAFAGDSATLHFTGFSKNGRYLAFEQYGIRDGAGFPYSELRFIDVERNAFVGKRVTAESQDDLDDSGLEKARRDVLEKAGKQLKKLGIQPGRTGKAIKLGQEDIRDETQQSFTVGKTRYRLVVKTPRSEEPACPEETSTALKVLVVDEASKKEQILQEDASPPSWRACAQGIQPYEAYVFGGKWLVVFLEVLVPDFEGPSSRYMAVTGALP